MSKVDQLRKAALVEHGRLLFFGRPNGDIFDCDGNVALIVQQIEEDAALVNQAPNYADLQSWEVAVAKLNGRLAKPVAVVSPEPEPEPYRWPYPALPEFHSVKELRAIPGKILKDILSDKDRRTGEPSQKAVTLRQLIDRVIAEGKIQ